MAKNTNLRLVDEFLDQPTTTTRPGRGRKGVRGSGQQTSRQASRDIRLEEGIQKKPSDARWSGGLKPRSPGQQDAIAVIRASDMTFLIGPAGTGKTVIAISEAVDALDSGKVNRIVLTRPAVEAGEKLGFLPGDMQQKLDPYMRPLYDALMCRMSPQRMTSLLNDRTIEIAPMGFMRGRTLSHCAVVVDEAQNATLGQLKMMVTRLGEGAFMVLTGDLTQSDLDPGDSGLQGILQLAEGSDPGIGVVRLSDADVVRHRVVRSLVRAFAA